MTMKLQVKSCRLPVRGTNRRGCVVSICNLQPAICNRRAAFTLIEILVTMVLLSLIVVALMAVFNSTQNAFRSSLTQTDILQSGRSVMGLIAGDLEEMTPSFSPSNSYAIFTPDNYPYNMGNNVNFSALVVSGFKAPPPLYQSLVGTDPVVQRTNVLEDFFSLSRQNINGSPSWVGTGYAVGTNSPDGGLYPLYRFYMTTNTITGTPASLYNVFADGVLSGSFTNSPPWSHLVDGVVDLTVRAYDTNGFWMTNNPGIYGNNGTNVFSPYQNTLVLPPGNGSAYGETSLYMFSNAVPASVQVELGILENTTLQHAEGLPTLAAQTNYLAAHAGQVHLFRQRVWIRSMDPAAYQ